MASCIVAAALLPLLLDPRGYWIRVLAITLLFAAMAQAWNIVGGLANQTSLGHAAFFGIGAYTSTVLLLKFGISPWLGMCAAGVLGGVAAFIVAIPTMRLQGHYFALATLAFGEVMRVIANVWTSVTGGPGGLSVPFAPPAFCGLFVQVASSARLYRAGCVHCRDGDFRDASGAARWAIGCGRSSKIPPPPKSSASTPRGSSFRPR